MRKLIYFVCCIFYISWLCSCQKEKEYPFDEQIKELESNPEAFITRIDTSLIGKIKTEKQATLFLLKSLSLYQINIQDKPDKQQLLYCIKLFSEKKKSHEHLQTLRLLANIYREEGNIEEETEIIEQAIHVAKKYKDDKWIYFLYNYLSDMYFRQYDLVDYSKYQSKALQFADNIDFSTINISTKILIAKNNIYSNHIENAITILQKVEKEISETDINYANFRRLFGIAYAHQEKWYNCVKQLEESAKYEKKRENLFICYTILIQGHYLLGNKEKYMQYKKSALNIVADNNTNFITAYFCKVCADIATQEKNMKEANHYLQWQSEIYNEIIKKQNLHTLDEIINLYNIKHEKKQHAKTTAILHYIIIFSLLLLIVALIIYIHSKKKWVCQLLLLQNKITLLEHIEQEKNQIKKDAISLILKDIEISKQIALLKHRQKEKFEKLSKDLERIFFVERNQKTQIFNWEKFYKYTDVLYDGFYTKLINSYPILADKEIQICCMLVIGFKTEEIAAIWQQSTFSVHKYKTNIRKKMKAPEGAILPDFFKQLGLLQNDMY